MRVWGRMTLDGMTVDMSSGALSRWVPGVASPSAWAGVRAELCCD